MSGLEMKYFVLKPISKNSNDIYAQASRKAMRFYANYISMENPKLAEELRIWADKESLRELQMKEADGTLPKISTFEGGR